MIKQKGGEKYFVFFVCFNRVKPTSFSTEKNPIAPRGCKSGQGFLITTTVMNGVSNVGNAGRVGGGGGGVGMKVPKSIKWADII